jgi:hypothetical protein
MRNDVISRIHIVTDTIDKCDSYWSYIPGWNCYVVTKWTTCQSTNSAISSALFLS